MGVIRKRGFLIVGVDQNTKLLGYYNPNTKQFEGLTLTSRGRSLRRSSVADLRERIRYRALLTGNGSPLSNTTGGHRRRRCHYYCTRTKDVCSRTSTSWPTSGYSSARLRSTDAAGPSWQEGLRDDRVDSGGDDAAWRPTVPVSARTDCLVALQQADVDGILTDDAILYGFLAQDPHTKLLPGNITDEPYGLAIAKDHPEFVRFVNAVLEQMHTDGRWTNIWRKWFSNVQIGGSSAKAPVQPRACYKEDGCVAP